MGIGLAIARSVMANNAVAISARGVRWEGPSL
jgi:hypothetical protein